MTRRTMTAGIVLAVCLLFVSSAMAAGPEFAGTWTVTFYPLPNLQTASATQCVVFTKDGSQLSVANSGTWTSPSFSGWSGGWYQIGNDFQWYGFFGSGTGNITISGSMAIHTIATGVFADNSPGVTNNLGSVVMKKVSACPAVRTSGSGDPTK